jgi:hypothetical protein
MDRIVQVTAAIHNSVRKTSGSTHIAGGIIVVEGHKNDAVIPGKLARGHHDWTRRSECCKWNRQR